MKPFQELVVISGKGGTGKTTLTASFTHLAGRSVQCDADVDAPDLWILLQPKIEAEGSFSGGKVARISPEKCIGCGLCYQHCRYEAISPAKGAELKIPLPPKTPATAVDDPGEAVLPPVAAGDKREPRHSQGQEGQTSSANTQIKTYRIDPNSCEGCGVCQIVCPVEAVQLEERYSGQWFAGETAYGPMVYARLAPGQENSGKLVTLVRQKAQVVARSRQIPLIIIDGPPGTGCPVISALTGVDLAVIVTEPTLSGKHDLERVAALAEHFRVPVAIVINKFDLNPEITRELESWATARNYPLLGHIPFSPAVTQSLLAKDIAVRGENSASSAIKEIWSRVLATLRRSEGAK